MRLTDSQIRLEVFNWLEKQSSIYDDVFPRSVLAKGIPFEDGHIPLISMTGIFKPRQLSYPISITSTTRGPYSDSFDKNELLNYKYREPDPQNRDNEGLREAMKNKIPLIYFYGIVPGKYYATWPVYIVYDNRKEHYFKVAVDDKNLVTQFDNVKSSKIEEDVVNSRRQYITSTIKVRLHQKAFRERVIHAYRSQCAFCRLKHQELLDAAHILPDTDPMGLPKVSNGISLCKIHHAAFDKLFIGIRTDYKIEVREDILSEIDGPMLLHGLQQLHGQTMMRPVSKNDWPEIECLAKRYESFRKAG